MSAYSQDSFYIDGEWSAPSGSTVHHVVSPADEEPFAELPVSTPQDVDRAVAAARRAFDEGPWPRMSGAERADMLRALAAALRPKGLLTAAIVRKELGSPIAFDARMADPPSLAYEWFADAAERLDAPEVRTRLDGGSAFVLREPVGVVAAVMPWNGPPYSAAKKCGAALAAGCTVVLKPPLEAPLDLYPLMEAAHEIGLPPGVLNLVPGGADVGEALVTHPGVDSITFTGSVGVGSRIAQLSAPTFKRTTLELGGKSAGIILDDMDLAKAGPMLAQLSVINAGQACLLMSRLLVSQDRHDEFVEVLGEHMGKVVVGHPDDPATQMGPVATAAQRQKFEDYVRIATDEGARVVTGGHRLSGYDRGYYVEPTLVANVHNGMRIAQEEVFGPIIAVIPYKDVDDAVRIANETTYGLSGGIFTADERAGLDVAKRVRAGTFNINTFAFDIGVPFGGMKCSGIGREGGQEGIDRFVEYKTINLPTGSRLTPADLQEK